MQKAGLFPETPRHLMNDAVFGEMVFQVMAQGAAEVSFGCQGREPTAMGLDLFERAEEYQKRYVTKKLFLKKQSHTYRIKRNGKYVCRQSGTIFELRD